MARLSSSSPYSASNVNALSKMYQTVSNRTSGNITIAVVDTPQDVIELDGEATNIAYKGTISFTLDKGHLFKIHYIRHVNGAEESVFTQEYDTNGAKQTVEFSFEDQEYVKFQIEAESAAQIASYEVSYASRGE